MSDDAVVAEEPVVVEDAPLDPAVQAALDQIRADKEARVAAAVAAQEAEDARCAELNAVKAKCEAVCQPVGLRALASTDLEEQAALHELQQRNHAVHEAEYDAAFRKFSGQRDGDINPAHPGVNEISSHASAAGGAEVVPS